MCCCHVPCKTKKMRGNIVPHRRKYGKGQAYKPGRFNAIALPPQSYYQGPLTCGPFWWRTTPVATKTRYHGVGGALLRARGSIRLSLFLFFIMNFLTRTCLSGSSLISLFLLGFRVGSSLFGIPFVKPFLL